MTLRNIDLAPCMHQITAFTQLMQNKMYKNSSLKM